MKNTKKYLEIKKRSLIEKVKFNKEYTKQIEKEIHFLNKCLEELK